MRFQAGIQIILLITAAVIVFTVIKPKFDSIQQTQVEAVSYQTAVDNIGQYNARLQELVNQARGISAENLSALYRYLPEEIDAVAVGRDIHNIADKNGLLLIDVVAEDLAEVVTETEAVEVVPMADPAVDASADANAGMVMESSAPTKSHVLRSQSFKVDLIGTYDSLKSMLQDIEKNDYPLRVVELAFTVDEEGSDLIEYSLVLETYSLAAK